MRPMVLVAGHEAFNHEDADRGSQPAPCAAIHISTQLDTELMFDGHELE